jgi:hypothetical protein
VLDLALVRGLVTPRRLATRAVDLWAPRRSGCALVLALLDARSPELVTEGQPSGRRRWTPSRHRLRVARAARRRRVRRLRTAFVSASVRR